MPEAATRDGRASGGGVHETEGTRRRLLVNGRIMCGENITVIKL